uniref:Uncharacterized protein n=1 Tax=Anguilla anguilla TaxID=7936 RepID=A0A0E9V975_ANGAN
MPNCVQHSRFSTRRQKATLTGAPSSMC